MPRSSAIIWPPVRIAMSSSIALRRSPNPGALTAATLRPPRNLLTTSVASASPSMSSATISNGRALCTTASRMGSSVFKLSDHLLRIGDEIRGKIAAVELHPLDDIELGFERLRLLDGDDAFIAHL